MKNIYSKLLLIGFFSLGHLSAFMQGPMVLTIPSNKALEVSLRSTQPASRISLSSREPGGFWTSNIDSLKDWKLPPGDLPVQVVYFQARLVGDKAELKVSVFSGSRFRENEDLIATYTLDEGESAVVNELARFGFVPPKIKMVFVAATVANLPTVVNDTRSLKVEVVSSAATLPAYIARVSNQSKKAVMGFSWHTARDKKIGASAMPRKLDGKPLIMPGETYERSVPIHDQDIVGDTDTFNVSTVVFEDGSYEGRVETAAQFRVWWHADKDTLARLIPIMRGAVGAAPSRPNISELIRSIEADKRGIARPTIDDLLAEFPDHKHLHKNFEGWMGRGSIVVINEVIGSLRNLEKEAVGRSDADANNALAGMTRYFQEWLTRLSK